MVVHRKPTKKSTRTKSFHVNELDIENKCRVGGDDTASTSGTVSIVRGDGEGCLLALAHLITNNGTHETHVYMLLKETCVVSVYESMYICVCVCELSVCRPLRSLRPSLQGREVEAVFIVASHNSEQNEPYP